MEDDLGLGVALYKKSPYNKLKALTNSPAAEVQKYTTPALEAQKIKFDVKPPALQLDTTGLTDGIKQSIAENTTNAIEQVGEDVAKQESGFFDNLLGDEFKMGNIATAAGLAMQLASLPAQFKSAKLANQAAAMNNQAFKEDRDSFKRAKANYSNIRFT